MITELDEIHNLTKSLVLFNSDTDNFVSKDHEALAFTQSFEHCLSDNLIMSVLRFRR
jgi:hypothetical protein